MPARKLPRVITCSNCGEQNPERARFCLWRGSNLIGAPAPYGERKIVTVPFCEAVGSTGGVGDPEDLQAALATPRPPLGVRPLLEEMVRSS
jgi:hypothetical protein